MAKDKNKTEIAKGMKIVEGMDDNQRIRLSMLAALLMTGLVAETDGDEIEPLLWAIPILGKYGNALTATPDGPDLLRQLGEAIVAGIDRFETQGVTKEKGS